MKTDLLYGVTPDATSVHKVKQTQRPNDIPACIEAYLLYCHPRQTIKVLESKPWTPSFPIQSPSK